MPYCFRSCGIALSILCIIISGLLNRLGCHLLFRSAILSRKRGFEVMAQDTLGPFGKLVVEICLLGFLVGTCVAYFVVIGDLGPSILSDILGIENTPHLRAFTMTFIGMFIALPLGLLRRVDSLSSFSILSFGLYLFLVMKLFSEATIKFLSEEGDQINLLKIKSTSQSQVIPPTLIWFDTSGLLTNIPIFAMALSCQTQLFELFDHNLLNFEDFNGVHRLNRIVRRAVHLCSAIYVTVGLFGYVAFYDRGFGGNILSFLPPSLGSTVAKIGFVATVAVSLPLCLFPARTSLFSLFVKKSLVNVDINSSKTSLLNDFTISTTPAASSSYMTDKQFRFLTIVLIVFTISLSVVVPHIEFVLSVIGSTTGTTICFILPGMIYTTLTQDGFSQKTFSGHRETTEKLLAKGMTWIGIFILIVCTFSTLNTGQNASHVHITSEKVADALKPKLPLDIIHRSQEDSGSGDHIKAIEDAIKKVKEKTSKEEQETKELKKKQEELLAKLEEQQKEQKHLIQEQKEFLKEIKKHEESEGHLLHKSVNQSVGALNDTKNDTSNAHHEKQKHSGTNGTELKQEVKPVVKSGKVEHLSPVAPSTPFKFIDPSMKGNRKKFPPHLTSEIVIKYKMNNTGSQEKSNKDLKKDAPKITNSKESQSGDFK